VDNSSGNDSERDTDDGTLTASQVTASQIDKFVDGIANEVASNYVDAPILDVPIPTPPATPPVVPPGEDRFIGGLNMSPDDEDVTILPPPPPLPAVSVEIQDEWAHLVAAFQRPLARLHHTWRSPMRRVVLQCWKWVVEPDERAALTNFVGFLFLPGVVSAMRGVKGGERPLDFLVGASREEHQGMTVINKAKGLRTRHSHTLSGPGRKHPMTQQLAQRVDGLVDEGRFSAAAVVVDQIVAKMRGAPNPPSLPVDAIREHIHRLHPDADEHNILPAAADDPEGVQLLVRHITTTIERLNVRSTSGATGGPTSIFAR
jgi:hypothetical protein